MFQTLSPFPFLHRVFSLKHYPSTSINHSVMSPAKSQGSSHHKGKKIASDDLAMQEIGEETTHSESNRSDKEEAQHDLDNECTPLINPWYDTHAHFPKVPGEYMPPPLGRVWLALCCPNTNVSWAPLASSILDLVIRQDTSLLMPILFEFGSSTALGWKEWVDKELSNMGFMESLQWAGVFKAIVLSVYLSNYRDLFNLCYLVRRWCSATHAFFISYGEITVTLEDVANQLLLPILGDVDPSALELSSNEEAEEAELRKGMSGKAKLSHWVGSFSKASVTAHRAAFLTFWLCKFIFGSHSHYAVKPLYFRLAIKVSVGVSLPLALMFLGHLYVQLDILQSDEDQVGSCNIVTSSVHSTILQHLLYERCSRHLVKYRPVPFAKERYQSCPRVITDFCGQFDSDFPLAFHWVGLKLIGHLAIEFFDKGVGFSWRAYRNLGTGFTCADSMMGPFVDTVGTTTPLTSFKERGITYLAATNAEGLPYLANEGV